MREKINIDEMKPQYTSHYNSKDFKKGDLVYYVDSGGYKRSVKWGVVEEIYTTEICLQLYDIQFKRLIDGKNIEEMKFPTRWNKLPKGWSYDMVLFHEEKISLVKPDLKINDKKALLDAIENGELEKVQNINYSHIEKEIDKKCGWRLVQKPDSSYRPNYVSLPYPIVYKTYEEAERIVKQYEAELKAQSEMSEEDWSWQFIECDLKRLQDKEKARKYRARLKQLENIEDVETRLVRDGFQWKYVKEKRWKTLEE